MRLALNSDQEKLIRTVREALSPGQPCFLVGGAVRDYLLSRPLHDLDFVLPEDPTHLARRVAKKLDSGYFVLDDQRHTARVVYKTQAGQPFPLDFVQFTGETLEADLTNRDFTLNAMALAVDDLDTVIDPLNGQADLQQKVLRPCSPHALVDDPVRILRAVRLAKQFSLAYVPGLGELAQAAARNLPNVSAERQRDELFKILGGTDAASGIADADRFGVFSEIIPIPEMFEEEGAALSRLDRALSSMTYFQAILKALYPAGGKPSSPESPLGMLVDEFGGLRTRIYDTFAEDITLGRPKSSLVSFGLILSGKGISKESPELAWDTARKYQLSNSESDWIRLLVEEKQAVAEMVKASIHPDRRTVYRFYKETGKTGVAIAVLHLADLLAQPGRIPLSAWKEQLGLVRMLLNVWWEEQEIVVNPKLFLNGHDIQQSFNLLPGAMIGGLLEELKEAQAAGDVETKAEAMTFIAGAIQNNGEGDEG
jgi:hypothetical protein